MKARVLFLLGCAACSPDHGAAYTRSLDLADQAEIGRRYADSAALYEEAAKGAKIPRDAEHARYLRALVLDRAGDRSGALAALDAIARSVPAQEDSDAAAYRAVEIRIEMGDPAGWRDLEAFLRHSPESGLARPALHRLLLHVDEERGDAGTVEYLRGLATTLDRRGSGEEIAYAIALRLARLGQTQAARDAFVATAARWPYPNGLLFDDALYRASELDEQLGRYDDAVAELKRMLASRESAWISGSYERPRYDTAQLRIADLYERRFHDDARARAALHELYASFKTSLLRDKALFREAELAAKDGDAGARCSLLATLVSDFPDSRYVACAIERCPSIAFPKASEAPKTCRPYVEREEKAEGR